MIDKELMSVDRMNRNKLSIDEVYKLLDSGKSVPQVAKEGGVSRQSVYAMLNSRKFGNTNTKKREEMWSSIKYQAIKQYMIDNDMSVKCFLESIGCEKKKYSTYYRQLRGETKPGMDLIAKVTQGTRLSFDEAFKESIE